MKNENKKQVASLKLTPAEQEIIDDIILLFYQEKVSHNFLRETIIQLAALANVQRLKQYSDKNNISIPGIKKCRDPFQIANYWVIANPD